MIAPNALATLGRSLCGVLEAGLPIHSPEILLYIHRGKHGDLTQGFLRGTAGARFALAIHAAKSRRATYIRLCATPPPPNFVLDEIKACRRRKRGGDVVHLALDFSALKANCTRRPIDPASIQSVNTVRRFFDKEWFRSLFAAAVRKIPESCARPARLPP
jgi:hypothetical protein